MIKKKRTYLLSLQVRALLLFPVLLFFRHYASGVLSLFSDAQSGVSPDPGAGICRRIRGRSFRCGGFLGRFLGRFLRCSIGVLCAAAGAVAVLEVMPQGIHILALIILAGILIAVVVGVALLRAGRGDDLTPIGVFRVRGRGGMPLVPSAQSGPLEELLSLASSSGASVVSGAMAAVVLDTMLLPTETSLSPVWVGTAVRAGRVSSVM